MPKDNKPAFSAKTIDDAVSVDELDKKTVKKKTATRKKKTVRKTSAAKKPAAKTTRKKTSKVSKSVPSQMPAADPVEKQTEISKQLNNIYQDSRGHMPNMNRIKVKKNHPIIKFLVSLIVVAGLLAAIAWAGFFILPNNNKFSEDKISLKIQGQKEITLGATSTYVISYANNQSTELKNAILTVQYPQGFVFKSSDPKATNKGNTEWDIGTIKPNEKKNITITGLTYGSTKKQESWRVFLTYQPEKYNYKAQAVDTLNVELKQTPFELSLTGPDKATLGNDVEYTLKVENKDKQKVGSLELRPSWSSDFSISTSSPALVKDKWVIDTSSSTFAWTFKVKGRFSSTTAKQATAKAALLVPLTGQDDTAVEYEINNKEITTELVPNNLNLSLTINGKSKNFNSYPGDTLNFTLYLKNTSKDELKDVRVELEIDAPSANSRSIMDWGNIQDKYDGDIIGTQLSTTIRRGEISWQKAYIPKLSSLIPSDEVNIDVSLPIRDINKFDLTQLKNYEIEVDAQASYKDEDGNSKTLSSNAIKIILNSDLDLEVRDVKSTQDGLDQHNLKWVLTNNFHELKNVKLSADIYGQVSYQADGQASGGTVNYDNGKQQLTWSIDKMPLALDTWSFPFSVKVNQKNPSQETLMSKVKLEAEDAVTGEKITLEGKEIKL